MIEGRSANRSDAVGDGDSSQIPAIMESSITDRDDAISIATIRDSGRDC